MLLRFLRLFSQVLQARKRCYFSDYIFWRKITNILVTKESKTFREVESRILKHYRRTRKIFFLDENKKKMDLMLF